MLWGYIGFSDSAELKAIGLMAGIQTKCKALFCTQFCCSKIIGLSEFYYYFKAQVSKTYQLNIITL